MAIPDYQEYAEQQNKALGLSNGFGLSSAAGSQALTSNLTAMALQQNLQNAQANMQNIYNGLANNTQGMQQNAYNGAWPASQAQQMKEAIQTDPNKDPALAAPLSALIDMWRAAFGDTWVAYNDVRTEPEFWRTAALRLLKRELVEQDGRYVRILEEQFWKS